MSRSEDPVYTPDQATALLGELGRCLDELRGARAVLQDPGVVSALARHAPGNGGGDAARRAAAAALGVARVAGRLDRRGIIIQDLDSGICDFPGRRGGRPIHLCWREGEPRVAHWHEIGAGFAGRRPIEADSATEGD